MIRPLFLLLALLVAASIPEKAESAPQAGDTENLVFDDENLTFPAEDEQAGDENIVSTDTFGDSTDENIQFEPLEVPETDFSQATNEAEPNEDAEAATALTELANQGSGRSQFAARGTLSGRETDLYRLVIEGEPQLWYIEVSGAGLARVAYVDAAEQQHTAQRMKIDGGAQFIFANLLLLPGEHWIRVEGNDVGEYAVRAVALGPPDPRSEVEPNDDGSRARKLSLGTVAYGLIYPVRDKDFFRFSLHAEELVSIRFEPPEGLSARVDLVAVEPGGGTKNLFVWRSPQPGQRMVHNRALPPGDYLLSVNWNQEHSKVPYWLRVDRLDPWSNPPDLEPNSEVSDALPLPENLTLRGSVNDRDDDWYRMPAANVATKITLLPAGPRPRLLQLFAAGKEGKDDLLAWNKETGVYEGNLPAGLQTNLRIRGAGSYGLDVAFDPPIVETAEPPGQSPVRIAFAPQSREFAAYLDHAQSARFQATLTNGGNEATELELELRSSHYAWQASLSEQRVPLGPGASRMVDVAVNVARDAHANLPVRITLGARDSAGRIASGSLDLHALCGAEPINPMAAGALPKALLGGLNVAWSALGAKIVAPDGNEKRYEELNDGMTPIGRGWYMSKQELPLELTVDLAGEEAVPIAGVLLHPLTNRSLDYLVRDFDVLLSEDGTTYREVFSGTLQRNPVEQAFVFDSIVPARFARLRIRSTQSGELGEVSLGEWKVIASPEATIVGFERHNLANPTIGGHVVWSTWQAKPRDMESMLTEGSGPRFRADPNLPNQWVIGFHHDRAARIEELQWEDAPNSSRLLSEVQVAISTVGPIGPWNPMGTWLLERGTDGVPPFRFDTPVWARFIRFSTTEPDRPDHWSLAKTLRVLETTVDGKYHSAIGEWGNYSREAAYELQQREDMLVSNEEASNDSRDSAQPVEPGATAAGNVTLGHDTDWYSVNVPPEANVLRVSLSGTPRLKARMTLFDESGDPIPDVHTIVEPLQAIIKAPVTGGSRVFVHVEEPPRAVAFVWDNSGSVSRYRETIYQSMARFGGEIKPGFEFGNLLPFQDDGGSFLLPAWSDQPHKLQAAINNYDRKDGSSAAESALLVAAKAFKAWNGTRAAVLLTDAETTSENRTSQLWQSLVETRPHIFTLHLHTNGGTAGARFQDLMQSWASVNGGRYTFFRSQADLDGAFERAACHIRRPATYQIEASTYYEEPPGPGFLSVEAGEAIAANAVELILDASGSMLQRLEGTRRIEIARKVLAELVNETIPEGTMLALRVFGHRKPDACDTDLAVPLQPLDPAKVTGVIQSTQAMNLARTPIGESLARVADDLEDVEGQKLIILITDGEETCDGNPAGAIADLKEAGHDVRINIVGFAIDDAALKAEFESWARMGGGLYFNASSATELDEALKEAMRPKFQVLDDTGAIIATGTTGGGELELPSGAYTVKILTSPVQTFDEVTIEPEKTRKISATANPEETDSEEKR